MSHTERVDLSDSVTIYRGDCREILPTLTGIDAVVADPPYSERTHSGHDSAANGHLGEGRDPFVRKVLGYSAWNHQMVGEVVSALPVCGWVCIMTDHTLARSWEEHLQKAKRYVFAPIPIVTVGRSVRLLGDGPSSWTDWLVVSRTAKESRWGTLPGYYEGRVGEIQHMGGKPLNAVQKIVCDYSKTKTTVLDFCMGSGTTGVACIRTDRKFIGIEIDPGYFAIARQRLENELAQGRMEL